MKNVLVLIATSLFSGAATAQSRESILSDTLYTAFRLGADGLETVVKKLPEYKVDSCLFDLLDAVVQQDNDCNKEVGYYFSCDKVGEKILVKISPVNFNRIYNGEYFGYFIYGARKFLCYGAMRCYVAKKPLTNPLVLTSFISTNPSISDIYLGGDTDGMVKMFTCNDGQRYALIKTCISPVAKKAARKQ